MTAHQPYFEIDTSLTQVSLVERRRDQRLVTTYRAARIVTALGQEQLGIVRNVSVGGVMIETHAPVTVGDRLWIEPRGCQSMWGTVVWSEELRHGVAFDAELSGDCLLALTIPETSSQVVRAPRISVDMQARLYVAGVWRAVRLCDLSQGGAKLDCPAMLAEAEPILLAIPGLGDVEGFVRWQRKGKVGLLFAEPLSIGTLSAWIAATAPQATRGFARGGRRSEPLQDAAPC